jgi:hypothetical protein
MATPFEPFFAVRTIRPWPGAVQSRNIGVG